MSDEEVVIYYPHISKTFKIAFVDARAYIAFLPLILFHNIPSVIFCVLFFAFFIVIDKKGYDLPNTLRWVSRFLGGRKIPASIRYKTDKR